MNRCGKDHAGVCNEVCDIPEGPDDEEPVGVLWDSKRYRAEQASRETAATEDHVHRYTGPDWETASCDVCGQPFPFNPPAATEEERDDG